MLVAEKNITFTIELVSVALKASWVSCKLLSERVQVVEDN